MNKRVLITSGCSFSETQHKTKARWPWTLHQRLGGNFSNTAMPSQGNGMIARKIHYDVYHQHKQGVDYQDMLVGVMWSGFTRGELYKTDMGPQKLKELEKINTSNTIDFNPIDITSGHPPWVKHTPKEKFKKWVIMNPWWKNYPYVNDFYTINDTEFLVYQSLEHIIRTQNFLQKLGIPYFMTMFTSQWKEFFENKNEAFVKETEYLLDMIDWENWLPVDSMFDWCFEKYPNDFPGWPDPHPGNFQNEEFVEQIILPFIKEKYEIIPENPHWVY